MRLKDLTKYQQGGMTVNKIQNIINKYGGGKSPVTAQDYMEVANKTGVPVDLLLAQGIAESNFGTKGRAVRTKNIGNVGNTDDGSASHHDSWISGLYRQANLLKNEYGVRGDSDVQRLLGNNFARPKGGHYASASDYGVKVGKLINQIRGDNKYSYSAGSQSQNKQPDIEYTPMEYVNWQQPQGSEPTDIRQFDFASLPKETQETVQENQRLQQEKLNQELMADKVQQENLAIEQELKNKALEREQILKSLPQAEFVGSNLKRNPYNELLQGSNPIT